MLRQKKSRHWSLCECILHFVAIRWSCTALVLVHTQFAVFCLSFYGPIYSIALHSFCTHFVVICWFSILSADKPSLRDQKTDPPQRQPPRNCSLPHHLNQDDYGVKQCCNYLIFHLIHISKPICLALDVCSCKEASWCGSACLNGPWLMSIMTLHCIKFTFEYKYKYRNYHKLKYKFLYDHKYEWALINVHHDISLHAVHQMHKYTYRNYYR